MTAHTRGAGREILVQFARLDPVVDRAAAHPEPARQLGLRNALVQIVHQQHPGLPSVHPRTASRSVGSANRAARRTFSDKPEVRNFSSVQIGELRSAPTTSKDRKPACNRVPTS